ncbi:hypothetical protein A2313_00540 [Candidatus Roizmanbacteria bacterium RIFOXYB2_FULL_41_10]|uniref:Uncharacterized protein n=1 Tax=Candidatus Roizmanbacteria bacterium RIFOXYA1_FULL_41_12 TaxID=1802082 RepID=A0A1F7KAJ4_9BACT|nr:MAG: hypothetical protein A2209_04180 [Candidatus Roizmanbacteria bacterium RIFOXYA1_FULL_41_12]OGK66868.1 MAG: hypothetical protein A2377_03145 [Candidatus Roizmanbacteria bacterium RIFOXYB1_FULL_41_27]OGK70758.1 MAG: hypothetical protein A2403_01560 [Candidatus Roizmanbacteria bacterium RIFOXYC1_FULL_41_16]OGK71450.1 MAG: hypothetical protein A2313_00540 [Candidatus Roizmanbacteria bacterium RIFOXYB2_FULL_41_10]OGK75662.1 MAG: hypothetical protein A2575_03135 [Candidatus Roizmanbacteria ba
MKKSWLLIFFAYWLFFWLIPPLQTPDENDHYETVYWLAKGVYPYQPRNRQLIKPRFTDELFETVDLKMKDPNRNFNLPDFKKIETSRLKQKHSYSAKQQAGFIPITLQSYQTPLYHFTAAWIFKLGQFLRLSLWHLSYFTRLTSALFYFGLVYYAYKSLRLLFPKKVAQPLFLFFALNPQVIRSGISINPDIAQAFLAMFFLYLVLKAKINTIQAAIVAGLTGLAKFSGVFTAPVANLLILLTKQPWTQKLQKIIFFNLIFLLLLAPWFYLNYSRYGTLTTTSGFFIASSHQIVPRPIGKALILAVLDFRHTLMHFSGFLGAGNERYPFKFFFIIYTVSLVLFGFWGFLRFIKKPNPYRHTLLIYGFFYLAFLYYLAFFFQKSGLNWDIQGRYFLNGFFLLTICLGYIIRPKYLAMFGFWHYLFILSFVLIPGYYV